MTGEHKISMYRLAKALDAVYRCASDDEDRPSINCVLIELGTHLKTTATNGHVLAHYTTDMAVPFLPAARYQVGLDDIRPTIEALKKFNGGYADWCDDCGQRIDGRPQMKDCTVVCLDDQIVLFDDDERLIHSMRIVSSAVFPPYEKVMPPRNKTQEIKEGFIAIAGNYLALIADCFKATFGEYANICIEPIGGHEAIICSRYVEADLLVVVCMPLQDQEGFVRPFEKGAVK